MFRLSDFSVCVSSMTANVELDVVVVVVVVVETVVVVDVVKGGV